MVITAFRSDAEESSWPPMRSSSPATLVEDRPRDAQGHCWDGHTCDHPDHDMYATIHFIR